MARFMSILIVWCAVAAYALQAAWPAGGYVICVGECHEGFARLAERCDEPSHGSCHHSHDGHSHHHQPGDDGSPAVPLDSDDARLEQGFANPVMAALAADELSGDGWTCPALEALRALAGERLPCRCCGCDEWAKTEPPNGLVARAIVRLI
jgi:hypothetical protein